MLIFLWFLIFSLVGVKGQIWQTGDNSTVEGCSSHCSVSADGDLQCWNSTLQFFEQSLITQLRHYVSVQVDIDQWHRRHGKKDGQNFTLVAEEILSSFESQLTSSDILTKETVQVVAKTLSDRIEQISDHTLSSVPHFQCPLPCEYRHDMYRNLFIASMILNVALLLSVVPSLYRSMKSDDVIMNSGKEGLMTNGRPNGNSHI